MEQPTQPGTCIIRMHAIYQNASLSEHQLQQQADDIQRRIIALQIDRGVDPIALAAAMAEQVARTQLAAQTTRNRPLRNNDIANLI